MISSATVSQCYFACAWFGECYNFLMNVEELCIVKMGQITFKPILKCWWINAPDLFSLSAIKHKLYSLPCTMNIRLKEKSFFLFFSFFLNKKMSFFWQWMVCTTFDDQIKMCWSQWSAPGARLCVQIQCSSITRVDKMNTLCYLIERPIHFI